MAVCTDEIASLLDWAVNLQLRTLIVSITPYTCWNMSCQAELHQSVANVHKINNKHLVRVYCTLIIFTGCWKFPRLSWTHARRRFCRSFIIESSMRLCLKQSQTSTRRCLSSLKSFTFVWHAFRSWLLWGASEARYSSMCRRSTTIRFLHPNLDTAMLSSMTMNWQNNRTFHRVM